MGLDLLVLAETEGEVAAQVDALVDRLNEDLVQLIHAAPAGGVRRGADRVSGLSGLDDACSNSSGGTLPVWLYWSLLIT